MAAPRKLVFALLGTLVLAAPLCGCRTEQANAGDYYLRRTQGDKLPPSSGSLGDIKRKSGVRPQADPPAPKLAQIVLIVTHDAGGKPVGIDVRHSSGDAALDERARRMVFTKRKFPRGQPNTVLVTVNPKSVPKK
jgi:outer membrane biosynthesis protein TonB